MGDIKFRAAFLCRGMDPNSLFMFCIKNNALLNEQVSVWSKVRFQPAACGHLHSQLQTNSETRHKMRGHLCGKKFLLAFGFGRKRWEWKKKQTLLQKLMSTQKRFLEQEGRFKGFLTHRGNRLANAPKGSHLWGSSLTTELRWFLENKQTRNHKIRNRL